MRGGSDKSRSKSVCIDFLTWLNGKKICSSEPLVADLRIILDTNTFRYIKAGGYSIDDILIRMKEDGLVFENDDQQTQLDHNTFFEFVEKNPVVIQ